MSRLTREINTVPSGNYEAGDTRIYGEKISVEFIMCINDLGFGSIMHDSRTRAVTKKTNCLIEVTPRILNKRVNLYRWIKYAIIKITGPDEASLNQCLRLLERHFPIFKQRKEYSRRANVTIFTNDLQIPDNVPGSTAVVRSGSTMSFCQGLVVKSPFELDNRRSLNQSPWKISKPEKKGRYFSTLLCENMCQPSLPPTVSSRNLDSNSKLYSGSLEFDKTKINKNKMFGSMGTLSDTVNQNITPENANMKSSQTLRESEGVIQNFTHVEKHEEGLLRSAMDNKGSFNFDVKNKFGRNKSPGFHHPINETNKSSSILSKIESISEDMTEDKLKLNFINQDPLLTMVPQERIKIFSQINKKSNSIVNGKQSTLLAPTNRKNIEEMTTTSIETEPQYSANRLSGFIINLMKTDNRETEISVIQVPENVLLPIYREESFNNIQSPEQIRNYDVKVNHGVNEVQISHSMSENVPSSASMTSRIEEPNLALKNNHSQITSDQNLISPSKADLVASRINLSYTSSKSMPTGSTVVRLINSPSSEQMSKSQAVDYQDALHAEKDLNYIITSSSIMINRDETSVNEESKPIASVNPKSSSVRATDEWCYVSKDTFQPIYNASEIMTPQVYEKIGSMNEERLLNFNVSRSKEGSDNQHNIEPKLNRNVTSCKASESPVNRDSQLSVSFSRDSKSPINNMSKETQLNINTSKDTNSPTGQLNRETKSIANRPSSCHLSDSQLDRGSKISIDAVKDFKPIDHKFDDEYKLNMVLTKEKTPKKDFKSNAANDFHATNYQVKKDTSVNRNSLKDNRNLYRDNRASLKDNRYTTTAAHDLQKDLRSSQNEFRNSQKDDLSSQKDLRNSQKDLRNSQKDLRNSQKDLRNSQKDNRESRNDKRLVLHDDFNIERANEVNENLYQNEHLRNARVPFDSRATENQSQVPEISTSIVAEDFFNVGNIQIKDMKIESRGSKTEISPVYFEKVTSAEIKINIQPVSGVSKNIVVSHSSIETPNGYYVNGINKPSEENQEAVNQAIEMKNDLNILKSISDRLSNPSEGNLILMFDGPDIFSTGQMSMVFKPGNTGGIPIDTKNQLVLFESSNYVITAGFRPGVKNTDDITKGVHAVSRSQIFNSKNG